ncbi:hypothetical protein FB567DRAFT_587886 [Paraphoma chrysanthemicola]|uniref:Uncharacterized protein n=1 Tax=Paraphoma chrysanthemicola TaxID=798071 RepID=A0A8K0W3L8_9PLEO|nr:hypothetical protein FB567DRAFT_587886 [Paraphoma chrysanthemicola]
MIPDGVIDDKSWAILTQRTEPYPDETTAAANAKHNLAPDEDWVLFPDMLAIQPATTSNGVDSNDGNRGPHFRWDGTIEGASQPPEYYAYSTEDHITWEQGLEIIEEFDWSVAEAQQSNDTDIPELATAAVVDANNSEAQKDGPAGDSNACLPCPTTEAKELEEEITAKPAGRNVATIPTISSAPRGATDNTAAPLAPLPEPSTVVSVEIEQPRIHPTDVDEAINDETALADQLEREMAQNIEIPVIEVEADIVQSHDLGCTIIKDTTQEAQETSLKATSQQQSPPEVLIELPEQDLPNAPSDTEQVAHHETEAEQWEEQLQEAAAEGITGLVAEQDSLYIVDAEKLDDEPNLEQDGRESARDNANEVCSANTNGRKRNKATSGNQSSDTETEAHTKKKARTRSPTPSDNAKQIKDEPNHEAEASAPAPIPRTRKSTSRKSVKESPEEVPAIQDQIMFTEPLQPSEGAIATLDNAKGVIHQPPTDSDHDMQEHLTDATNSPTQASLSLSQSQRASRHLVSNRELQALGSTLMPGMHLGLHLRAESRPARTKRSVDTPVQSANEGNGKAFLIDEGMDEESEEEVKKTRKKKKRPSAAAGRKTPAKKSKKETIGGGRASSAAVGMKGEQRRLINEDEEEKEMEEEDADIHDLFPAPKIDTNTEQNAPSNATPHIPKSIPRRAPAPSTKKPAPRAPQIKPNNEPTYADDDSNDTDELAPSPQHPSRQRKRADDADEEYIDPYPTQPTLPSAPSSTLAVASTQKSKKTKPTPRTSQVKPIPPPRSKSPMVAIAVKQSPVAKAASSPLVKNKFGFSPRKTRAGGGGTAVTKGAKVKGKGEGKGKSTTKTTSAAKGGLKIKKDGEDGTVVQAKHASQGTETDRRVTRRASTIALEIAAAAADSFTPAPGPAPQLDIIVAKSMGKQIPVEGAQGENDGPKTRRAVGVMGEEKDKEMEMEMEKEKGKEESIGKRLRSKS